MSTRQKSVAEPAQGGIEPDRLYDYDQAAEVLGVNRYWVRNAVRDGRLPATRLNKRGDKRVRGRDILAWLDAGGVQ